MHLFKNALYTQHDPGDPSRCLAVNYYFVSQSFSALVIILVCLQYQRPWLNQ